jgi:hypothetical protein
LFGFERDEDGAQFRFVERKVLFEKAYKRFPHARYYWWWLVHNIVSHPLIGLLPVKMFFNLHDWTSRRMHPPVGSLTAEEKIKIGKAYFAYTLVAIRAMREDCIREGKHARSRKFCEHCHTALTNDPFSSS